MYFETEWGTVEKDSGGYFNHILCTRVDVATHMTHAAIGLIGTYVDTCLEDAKYHNDLGFTRVTHNTPTKKTSAEVSPDRSILNFASCVINRSRVSCLAREYVHTQ